MSFVFLILYLDSVFLLIVVSCLFLDFSFNSYICIRKITNERIRLCHE